jgi:hypothetical protein
VTETTTSAGGAGGTVTETTTSVGGGAAGAGGTAVETTTEVGGTTTGGLTNTGAGAGAQASNLANTGGAHKSSTSLPLAGGLLGGLAALLAAAAIKRREILSKIVR